MSCFASENLRALVVLLCLAMVACSPCENIVLREVPSGSGKKAVVFSRECGATTGFSTQLSILGAEENLPDDGGNALVLGGKEMVEDLHWEAPTRLSIKFKPGAKVFSKKARVAGVEIVYAN